MPNKLCPDCGKSIPVATKLCPYCKNAPRIEREKPSESIVVKFIRKPAKMGMDYIFWIPRVYIKNGLVDPTKEYNVILEIKEKRN